MTSSAADIVIQRYGRPLATQLRQWWLGQEDLLVSLISNETASTALGLDRLARMVAASPALVCNPPQARAALIGLLIAHGDPAGDVIEFSPQAIRKTAPSGLHALASLLLPMALRCGDDDLPEPPPADLVSACLLANDPQILDGILSSAQPTPRTINGLPWLHHAAMAGKIQCMEVLIRHGCDPHGLDPAGNTALHNASTPEIVALLMAAGVDAARTNNAGHMPAQAWGQRTKDRARQEALLSVLLSSPHSTPDPVESFFSLAQSNNMGRLKSFARKLGVDYSIRHGDQGLVFNAALRLAREALKVTELSSTVPQEARIASSWLGFLVDDAAAAAAATPIERQGVIAMADALAPATRPLINFRATTEPGHLRHLVLALAASMPPPSNAASGPSIQVRRPVQKLFVGAIEQALDANDANSVSDAIRLAIFAFDTSADTYLHQRVAPILASRLHAPEECCDALMLSACKSLHEATRHTAANDTAGFPFLATLLGAMKGPLDKTREYLAYWDGSVLHDQKRIALQPLMATARAHQMNHSTPTAPKRPPARF